jgi:hypothetical protein
MTGLEKGPLSAQTIAEISAKMIILVYFIRALKRIIADGMIGLGSATRYPH